MVVVVSTYRILSGAFNVPFATLLQDKGSSLISTIIMSRQFNSAFSVS